MATPLHQAPTADTVGKAFVRQYYLILQQSPQLVHRFYRNISKLGRPEENGAMSITTTMQAINDKILALHYGEFSAEIATVDAQESYNGGVIVLVTGYLTGKDIVRRKFSQSFFLAPQDRGYFVLNDVFRYVDDAYHVESPASTNDVEAPITPDKDHSPVQENHVSHQTAISSEEVSGEEVDNPSENGGDTIEEKEAPVPEVVDAIPDDTHVDAESNSKVEEVPKKSYASIVKVMKDSALPISSPPPASLRSIMKVQEQPPASATSPAPASEKQVTNSNATESGNNQEAEGPSIYLKGLPPSATHALLENEFKKFGTIRAGGIQVKTRKEFPEASRFPVEGIDPELKEKLKKMILNTIATGDNAWAPSESTETSTTNSIQVEENTCDSDDFVFIEATKEKKGKRVVAEGKKVGGAAKLSRQIDRLVDAVERRSTITTNSQDDTSGASVVKALGIVASLPGVEAGGDLWLFASRLFLDKVKRDIFNGIDDPEVKLKWLNYEKTQGL